MARTVTISDAHLYRMDMGRPHEQLEPLDHEINVVDAALQALVEEGILPHKNYDQAKLLAHRQAVLVQADTLPRQV